MIAQGLNEPFDPLPGTDQSDDQQHERRHLRNRLARIRFKAPHERASSRRIDDLTTVHDSVNGVGQVVGEVDPSQVVAFQPFVRPDDWMPRRKVVAHPIHIAQRAQQAEEAHAKKNDRMAAEHDCGLASWTEAEQEPHVVNEPQRVVEKNVLR